MFEVSDEYLLPDNDNLSDEFVGNIESNHFVFNVNKLEIQSCPTFDITNEGSKLNVLADSGATINLMSYQTFKSLKNNPYLVTSNVNVYAYGSKIPLRVIAQFTTQIQNIRVNFHVVENVGRTLFSFKTSQELGMITVANNVSEKNVNQDHSVIKGSESKVTSLSACKGDPVKIDIDTSIKPVAQPHRRIPFHMRELVENEIENLLKADIIEKSRLSHVMCFTNCCCT